MARRYRFSRSANPRGPASRERTLASPCLRFLFGGEGALERRGRGIELVETGRKGIDVLRCQRTLLEINTWALHEKLYVETKFIHIFIRGANIGR
jgi:hypothetical protein